MKVVLVLTSGDALLQRVTMSSSILFIVHNLFAQDLYSFKQKKESSASFVSNVSEIKAGIQKQASHKCKHMSLLNF